LETIHRHLVPRRNELFGARASGQAWVRRKQ
jgi:hypothetical protein